MKKTLFTLTLLVGGLTYIDTATADNCRCEGVVQVITSLNSQAENCRSTYPENKCFGHCDCPRGWRCHFEAGIAQGNGVCIEQPVTEADIVHQ